MHPSLLLYGIVTDNPFSTDDKAIKYALRKNLPLRTLVKDGIITEATGGIAVGSYTAYLDLQDDV